MYNIEKAQSWVSFPLASDPTSFLFELEFTSPFCLSAILCRFIYIWIYSFLLVLYFMSSLNMFEFTSPIYLPFCILCKRNISCLSVFICFHLFLSLCVCIFLYLCFLSVYLRFYVCFIFFLKSYLVMYFMTPVCPSIYFFLSVRLYFLFPFSLRFSYSRYVFSLIYVLVFILRLLYVCLPHSLIWFSIHVCIFCLYVFLFL